MNYEVTACFFTLFKKTYLLSEVKIEISLDGLQSRAVKEYILYFAGNYLKIYMTSEAYLA